jgi:DNA-directed RNA polymerase subunit RPC12/RpoP
MEDLQTRETKTLACPRCRNNAMKHIITIAPVLDEPGLLGFECPRCGYVTRLVQAAERADG